MQKEPVQNCTFLQDMLRSSHLSLASCQWLVEREVCVWTGALCIRVNALFKKMTRALINYNIFW